MRASIGHVFQLITKIKKAFSIFDQKHQSRKDPQATPHRLHRIYLMQITKALYGHKTNHSYPVISKYPRPV
mgnify:CR=1 FL=1